MKIFNNDTRTPSPAKCPSTQELVHSFSSKASKRSKERIIDHISECQECRDAFSLLMDIAESDSQNRSREAAEDRRSGLDRLSVRYAMLALGFLLIVSSALFLARRGDISRDNPAGRASFLLSYPLSSHPISKPLIFRWKACSVADRYVLELFDESLLPLWTSGTTAGTQIVVPSGTEIGLEAEKSYFWTVTAYSGGDKVSESAMARFTVTR